MAQGWKFTLTLNGTPFNFKRTDVREEAISINVASRYLPDGTLNDGHNAEEGDLRMAIITAEGLQDADDNTDMFFNYQAGVTYDSDTFVMEYDSYELYSGTGFYVRDAGTGGSIPGEAS